MPRYRYLVPCTFCVIVDNNTELYCCTSCYSSNRIHILINVMSTAIVFMVKYSLALITEFLMMSNQKQHAF